MADETFQTFEDGLRALEEVVRCLEQGDLPLEDALRAFERGIALVRQLNQRLGDVEARIEVLSCDLNGDVQLQPLDPARIRKE